MNTSEGLHPHWGKWLKMINATDFQLIALSLNYEPPSTIKTISRFQGLSCFAERLSIIKNHMTNTQLHRDQRRCDITDKFENYVQLDTFVKWAVDVMTWDLPPALLAIYPASIPAPSQNLTQENELLKQRISELEQQLKQSQQLPNKSNKANDVDLLAYILDSTQKHYAPDLALSIQLYKYVYIDKLPQDTHTSMGNSWITRNTNYDKSKQSAGRIREITTPFNNWNSNRDKNYFKP